MATKAKRVSKRDIDGTIEGVCVSVIVRLDPDEGVEPLVSVDRYLEGRHPDPELTAERVWQSIRDDWPGCAHTVALNERARYLMAKRRVEQILGEGSYTFEDHLNT